MPGLQALQWHHYQSQKRFDSCSRVPGKIRRKGNRMIQDIIGAILGALAFVAIWILAACL